jgi:hypothetical protein
LPVVAGICLFLPAYAGNAVNRALSGSRLSQNGCIPFIKKTIK